MPDLIVRTVPVGPWQMNAYALICPHTQQSAILDPGDDADLLIEAVQGTTPMAVLLTHTHPDHVGALAETVRRLNVPLYAHPLAKDSKHMPDLRYTSLSQGDTFTLGEHIFRVHETPGHIPDQICFIADTDPVAMVGDTIFDGGPGRTNSAADFRTTLETLRKVVLGWNDDLICYPGHGSSFRLGDRRAQIEAFVNADHPADFSGDAEW